MKWTEIKKWASNQGYTVDREKTAPRTYLYTWSKDDSSGTEHHVSDLAKSIFNHLTDNKWIGYQEAYTTPEPDFEKELKTW